MGNAAGSVVDQSVRAGMLPSLDLIIQRLLTGPDAYRGLPEAARGVGVSGSRMFGWVRRGARGLDGKRHGFRAVRGGGRWVISRDALLEFFTPLSNAPGTGPPADQSAALARR